MRRVCSVALVALAVCGQQQSPRAVRDRYFARYPFDKWLTEADTAQLHWSAQARPAKLTAHQRLASRIEIELDAKEIARRRGRGELVTLVEILDSTGRQWRIHNTYDLTRIPADAKPRPVLYAQEVFLLPGDYQVAIAACDSETGEHSFVHRRLHVAELHNDALALSGRDLPPVEFVRALEAPDNWFQPYIRGRLKVGLETSRPVHVDLVMNMTPSDRALGSLRVFRRNMSVLIPALKILAGLEVGKGTLDVSLIDLTRQKVWEQKSAHGLDWVKMRAPLANNQPGVIDAQSLAAKAQMAQFFRDQVIHRATAAGDDLRVVIVLSAPVFLEHQFPLEPASVERDSNRRIFYLRYRPLPGPPNAMGPAMPISPAPLMTSMASDDLEHALKPLDARVLSISTPEEFRKALASMLADIRKM